MKILITTDWYAPTVNGVVTSVLNLRGELMQRGHDIRVLTLLQTLHSFESAGVTYIGSVGAGKLYPGARIKTIFFSRFVQDIMVHTYHTVYEDYTHYFSPSRKWGRHMVASLSRWIIGQADCVIVPTIKVQTILKGYGINQDIHVIPTGIDLSRFTKVPTEEKRLAIRKQLGIPEGNQVLLYVGRHAKEKNLEELLQYHAKWNTQTLTLLIVGDGPHRGALEQMTSELGIQNSVRFAGMIHPEHVGDYYHIGDLFVSASVSETQGLTYIEALATGLPTLCRKDERLDGVILNEHNGWQYENGQHYLDKLDDFFANEEMRNVMQKNAAGFAYQAFSSAVFAEKVECIYFDVLKETDSAKNEKVACQGVISCR